MKVSDEERRLHEVRSGLIGATAELEDHIDAVLALHLGRNTDSAWTLYTDVITRLPLPSRLNLLEQVLEETLAPRRPSHTRQLTFAQAAPLLMPLLKQLIDARHALAHSVVLPAAPGADPDKVRLRVRRRGRIDVSTVSLAHLEALAEQFWPLWMTLDDVAARAGDLTVWGEFMGFDQGAEEDTRH